MVNDARIAQGKPRIGFINPTVGSHRFPTSGLSLTRHFVTRFTRLTSRRVSTMSPTEQILDAALWDSMRLKAGIPLLAWGRQTSPLCLPNGLPFKLFGSSYVCTSHETN